jgi:hypothetical protein
LIWHWFLHYTGSDNTSGVWYGFWSGFASDIAEITLVLGFITYLRHRNCHVKGCWRLGHADPDHGWPACKKHHSKGDALGIRPADSA